MRVGGCVKDIDGWGVVGSPGCVKDIGGSVKDISGWGVVCVCEGHWWV